MPKFYCEYCGIYLTHSSPSGRGQHAKGRKHINNRIEYYKQIVDDITKENQDKMKQMQVAHTPGGQFSQQLTFPQAYPHAHQPQMLLQLQHLSAGGISQMQINSTQPKPGQTAPPQQGQMPMMPPPQLFNMPMGAAPPGMMQMRQPPGLLPMPMKPMPPFGGFAPTQPMAQQTLQPPQNLQPPQIQPPQSLPSQPFSQPLPGFVSMPINPDRQIEMVPKEE